VAKRSREERQRQQALEQLPSALKRGNAERAVAALLRLSAPERTRDLRATAFLVRADIARDFQTASWSRLAFWAARSEQEPRLLTEGSTLQEQREAHWALLWGAARACDWARAHVHLSGVAPQLPSQLAAGLKAYVNAHGSPAPQALPTLRSRPPNHRLGYDPGQRPRRRVSIDTPTCSDEVEPAVLASRALLGPTDFLTAMEKWAAGSPELAPAILHLAARLLSGEIYARLAAGAPAWHPARAVARLCRQLGAPPDLQAEAASALRVAGAAVIARGAGFGREEAQGLADIAGNASLFPNLCSSAIAVAAHSTFTPEARSIALDMLKELTQRPNGSVLLLKALAVWSAEADPGAAPPRWIEAGMTRMLGCAGELAKCLRQLPVPTQHLVVEAAPGFLQLEDAERFLDQAWSWAEESAKPVLLDGLDELLMRACARRGGAAAPPTALMRGMLRELSIAMGLNATDSEFAEMLDSPFGRQVMGRMMSADNPDGRLPPAARAIFDRFASRIVPYRISYLEMALVDSRSKSERIRAVEFYLGEKRSDVLAVLEAVRSAELEERALASKALLDHLLGSFRRDRDGLARALLEAGRLRLRRGIRGPLARAFNSADAQARAHGEADSESVATARLEAGLLARRSGTKPDKRKTVHKPLHQGTLPLGEGNQR